MYGKLLACFKNNIFILLEKPVQKTKHHEQVSDIKNKLISKEEINSSSYSQPDLNDKNSDYKIEKITKEEINASIYPHPAMNGKVSETTIKQKSKPEIEASNYSQL